MKIFFYQILETPPSIYVHTFLNKEVPCLRRRSPHNDFPQWFIVVKNGRKFFSIFNNEFIVCGTHGIAMCSHQQWFIVENWKKFSVCQCFEQWSLWVKKCKNDPFGSTMIFQTWGEKWKMRWRFSHNDL